MHRHTESEDLGLIPLAERLLSAEEDTAVERAFLEIEERSLGRAGSEALVALGGAVAQASHALAAGRPQAGAQLVARDVMRPKPGTVAPEESLARAAELMESFHSRELPVVSGRKLLGIVTRTDMEPHRGHYEWTTVRAAMTMNPVCVAPETPVAEVARLLRTRGFNAVPVRSESELVGMIARADLLKVLAQGE
jgi:CBS domain-containing protein